MNKTLIYNDEGISPESLQETINLFKRLNYQFSVVSAAFINNESWEKNTSLFVIPGGRANPYHDALYPLGCQKILNFIAKGGRYLGICAGGYYGASQIVFEKGNPDYEIVTKNTLGLYTGIAEGPAYELGVFRYHSEEGARTAAILSEEGASFPTYFNGGCWFHSPIDNTSKTRIIARYADIDTQPAAIILSDYGKGRVCLSGVHFEYNLNDNFQAIRDNFVRKLFVAFLKKTN
jgi:glutamine amidotransferase-like uncharacterized protein